MAAPATSHDNGDHLMSPHNETREAFQRVESYDACEASDGEDDDDNDAAFSLNELLYSAHSFHVISGPG